MARNVKIYVSGPITNNTNYLNDFGKAEEYLLSLDKNHVVINPCKIIPEKETYEEYMRADLRVLLDCDTIYMLKGWAKSKGASLEKSVAEMIGMKVFYD